MDHRKRGFYTSGSERPYLEIDVMLFHVFFGRLHELHGNEFESTLLEPFDDVPDEPALNSVRLHHDEGSFLKHETC